MSLFAPPELIRSEVFAEVPAKLRKSGTPPDMGAVWIFSRRGEPLYRVQSCASDLVTNVCFGGADRRTLYITDSGSGSILTAQVPTAGRMLYSHT